MPKQTLVKTVPLKIDPPGELLGFTEENVHESFFWSTISTLAMYGCVIPSSTLELRNKAMKKLRSGILNNKLKDFTFNLNYHKYITFVEEFKAGKVGLDPEMYLAEALASALHRPIIFLSSLPEHKDRPIIYINHDMKTPPLIYGIYEKKGHKIFLPFFFNNKTEFRLEKLKGLIQIIAYVA